MAIRGSPTAAPERPVPLACLLKDLQQAWRVTADEALQAFDLSMPQVTVLAALQQAPGLSNAELARAGFIRPQSMGGLLAELEGAGLVVRRPRPDGGRAMQTELTLAGTEMLEGCCAVLAEVEARLLGDLAPEERQQLHRLVERCVASFRATAPLPR